MNNQKAPRDRTHYRQANEQERALLDAARKTIVDAFMNGHGADADAGLAHQVIRDVLLGMRSTEQQSPMIKHVKVKVPKRSTRLDQVTCHHCGALGASAAMKRWHFDNCRVQARKIISDITGSRAADVF